MVSTGGDLAGLFRAFPVARGCKNPINREHPERAAVIRGVCTFPERKGRVCRWSEWMWYNSAGLSHMLPLLFPQVRRVKYVIIVVLLYSTGASNLDTIDVRHFRIFSCCAVARAIPIIPFAESRFLRPRAILGHGLARGGNDR